MITDNNMLVWEVEVWRIGTFQTHIEEKLVHEGLMATKSLHLHIGMASTVYVSWAVRPWRRALVGPPLS